MADYDLEGWEYEINQMVRVNKFAKVEPKNLAGQIGKITNRRKETIKRPDYIVYSERYTIDFGDLGVHEVHIGVLDGRFRSR